MDNDSAVDKEWILLDKTGDVGVWIKRLSDRDKGKIIRNLSSANSEKAFKIWSDLILGWQGVKDIGGPDLPYTPENLKMMISTNPSRMVHIRNRIRDTLLTKEASKCDKALQKKQLDKVHHAGDKAFMRTASIVFIISFLATFIYFNESLWTLVNLVVGLLIGGAIGLGAGFIAGYVETKNNSAGAMGMGLIVLGMLAFWGIHSGFYVSPEDRAARTAERSHKEQMEKEQKRAAVEAAQKQEEEETADFLASGQDIKVYGVVDADSGFMFQAKDIIKHLAHDPDSVTDVEATSKCIRVRIKEYPNCRYALAVRFRAKNAFGGIVLQEGYALFDRSTRGIAFLPNFKI